MSAQNPNQNKNGLYAVLLNASGFVVIGKLIALGE